MEKTEECSGSASCIFKEPNFDESEADYAVRNAKNDLLKPSLPGSVQIDGWLGEKLDLSLKNRVMSQDLDLILHPYRERLEENSGHWRCEYWGKWFTSAVLGCAYEPTPAHRAVIDRAVEELISTQTPDGYIGTYKDEEHLGIWDVWGRKYTLLGLIAAYDLTGSRNALEAACRVADHLYKEAPPGAFNLTENGIDLLKGLSSSSILEPLALLYQRTGEPRYLELAENIIACWSKPNRFFEEGQQLIAQALAKVPPEQIGSQKAYEMMSCFEGLCEMYRISGESQYLESAVEFAKTLKDQELMIHGSGSNKELWCDGTRVQTEILEQPTETCVTVTWMKFCHQLLRLTGDSMWADELEVSLYNALLGSMTPDGAWWAYFSPLSGQRVPSHYQHEDVEMSCCVANGPRGLFLTSRWAVMTCDDGITVNLYTPGKATVALADGTTVRIAQKTDYPVGNEVVLSIDPETNAEFLLNLRIPGWSHRTTLSVNGEPVSCRPGGYVSLKRTWRACDEVVLKLDLRGRAVPAPSGAPQFSVMRGPIVLALDNRLSSPQDIAVRLAVDQEGYVELKPAESKPDDIWMAFEVPFDVKPRHYVGHYQVSLVMCDYASAGNRWSGDNLFRVWLPQPLFLRHMYPADTWRLMCPELDACPSSLDGAAGKTKRNDFHPDTVSEG